MPSFICRFDVIRDGIYSDHFFRTEAFLHLNIRLVFDAIILKGLALCIGSATFPVEARVVFLYSLMMKTRKEGHTISTTCFSSFRCSG